MTQPLTQNASVSLADYQKISEQAHALFYAQKYSEAIPLYKKLITPDLRDFIVLANLGIALRHMGQYTTAAIYLSRADELCPNSPAISGTCSQPALTGFT
jgi:tetratricopeptide (TPR) repeat protein